MRSRIVKFVQIYKSVTLNEISLLKIHFLLFMQGIGLVEGRYFR